MGFSSLVVRIEPNPGIFFSGQLITGNVHAAVDSSTSCRTVKVSCEGKAKVHWSEAAGGGDRKNFDASEEYFNLSFILWNGPNNKIQPGNYVWPFQFSLPKNIPSSFEGARGWIRYSIKTIADIPFGFDTSCKVYFSVTDTDDLNYNEIAKLPMSIQRCDTSCCWCCAKGPVQLNFNCPRSGAVVGEGFKIRGEISNEGSKPVKNTEIKLEQIVKYHVRSSSKTDYDVVAKIQRGGIEPGESEFYEDAPLNIEAVVPNLRHCSIMDLDYKLYFSANFGTCASVSDSAILFIGTVPFIPEGMGMAIPVQQGPYVSPGYPSSVPPPYSPYDPNTPIGTMDSKGEGMAPSAPPADVKVNFPTPGYPDQNASAPYPSSFQSPMGPNGFITPPPAVQYPPSQPNNANIYGLRGAPSVVQCYFCTNDRRRLDRDGPPPKYLSYAGILADAP